MKTKRTFKTESEIIREEKNKAAVKYYQANREKVLKQRQALKTEKRKEECREKKIPEYLAKYITFTTSNTIELRFKDPSELKKVLYWLKFKSDYTEDIRNEETNEEQ